LKVEIKDYIAKNKILTDKTQLIERDKLKFKYKHPLKIIFEN